MWHPRGGQVELSLLLLTVFQISNVLTRSKMKVWKFAAIGTMVFGSMLSVLVCRDMLSRSLKSAAFPLSLFSRTDATYASSSPSLAQGSRRFPRELGRRRSLISQCKLLCLILLFSLWCNGCVQEWGTLLPRGFIQGLQVACSQLIFYSESLTYNRLSGDHLMLQHH